MAYTTLSDLFTGICDAIRAKKGTTGTINHQDIPSEIAGISGKKTIHTTTSAEVLDGDIVTYRLTATLGEYNDGDVLKAVTVIRSSVSNIPDTDELIAMYYNDDAEWGRAFVDDGGSVAPFDVTNYIGNGLQFTFNTLTDNSSSTGYSVELVILFDDSFAILNSGTYYRIYAEWGQ